jgi:hypothetical protein
LAAKNKHNLPEPPLEAGDFYYNHEGLMVFTSQYLLKRGYCCESGCKHCPYGNNDGKLNDSPGKN